MPSAASMDWVTRRDLYDLKVSGISDPLSSIRSTRRQSCDLKSWFPANDASE